MKSYIKNKRFIHVSKPPLYATALLGEETANNLYNAQGTYRRSDEVPIMSEDTVTIGDGEDLLP